MRLLPRLRARLGAMFAPAEDPRASTTSVYRRQLDLFARLEAALDGVTASKRRIQAQVIGMEKGVASLEQHARQALLEGRDDVARVTLIRRRELAAELQRMARQADEATQEEEGLRLARQRLGARIEALRSRQEVVSARYAAAEAQVRLNEALAGVSSDLEDFGTALHRAEAKTEHMQARAVAIDELMRSGALAQGSETADLVADMMLDPGRAEAVEQELQALRGAITQQAGGSSADRGSERGA